MNVTASASVIRRRNQQGIVLFVALIVLVIMAMTGLAMMRQSTSGIAVAGNIGFKQNATSGADLGIEFARLWYVSQTAATRNSDDLTKGYHSSWGPATSVDPTQLDWSNEARLVVNSDSTGNEVRVVIHRLCETPNVSESAPGQRCSKSTASSGDDGNSKSGGSYGNYPLTPQAQTFYRVTARVKGPKNTISYTQVVFK
jgi:type IV pilus assembly protein PilX